MVAMKTNQLWSRCSTPVFLLHWSSPSSVLFMLSSFVSSVFLNKCEIPWAMSPVSVSMLSLLASNMFLKTFCTFFLPSLLKCVGSTSQLLMKSLTLIGCPNFWTIWLWASQNALLGAGSSVHTRGKYSCMSFSLYFLSTTIWQMRCCSFQLPSAIASWGMSVFLCVFLKFSHCYLSTTSAPTNLWTVVWGVNKQFLSP